MNQLHLLDHMHPFEPDPFWEFVDEKPEELYDEETNQFWSIFGVFLGVTATLLSIFALIWNLLAGLGFGGMAWYDWLGLAIFMFVLVLQGWGMVSIFISVDNPSPQENFRAWRINFLGGFVAACAQVLVFLTWLIASLVLFR